MRRWWPAAWDACVSKPVMRFDESTGKAFIADKILVEGDIITIDGGSGEVYGRVETIQPKMSDAFAEIMSWADGAPDEVRTNAETPTEARVALGFGAWHRSLPNRAYVL